jgi:hypothetical protein
VARQHTKPVIVGAEGAVSPLTTRVNEDFLQSLIERSPAVLPLSEIDTTYANPVHLCREMSTSAGPIDNILVTNNGHLVVVECKLWRNSEARRQVVGQILDYAKELSRFTSADLQREVNRRLGTNGDVVFDLVNSEFPGTDQIAFNDALTKNLRKGRFMLLIVGDGIREGVESIAEYVAEHSGLHFTLGLVELPVFELPGGDRLVTPRVVAHTTLVRHIVFDQSNGSGIDEEDVSPTPSKGNEEFGNECFAFWTDFLNGLRLDDPQQPIPKPVRIGNLRFNLPVPGSTAWLTVFKAGRNRVGVFVGCRKDSVGEEVFAVLRGRWNESLAPKLGIDVSEDDEPDSLSDVHWIDALASVQARNEALAWLRQRTNDFINVLRAEVPGIVEDLGG